jgi:hypothetical protein
MPSNDFELPFDKVLDKLRILKPERFPGSPKIMD